MWCHLSIRHSDCCIRVIALLEYFEWILSKQHRRSKGKGCGFSMPFLSMLVVGVKIVISYLCSIIKGHVPQTQSLRLVSSGCLCFYV